MFPTPPSSSSSIAPPIQPSQSCVSPGPAKREQPGEISREGQKTTIGDSACVIFSWPPRADPLAQFSRPDLRQTVIGENTSARGENKSAISENKSPYGEDKSEFGENKSCHPLSPRDRLGENKSQKYFSPARRVKSKLSVPSDSLPYFVTKRKVSVSFLLAATVLVSVVLHNAATYESIEPTNPNARTGLIKFGWPLACFTGRISVEQMFYATGPRQHWRATSRGEIILVGLAINLLVALLLCVGTYRSLLWTLAAFRARLSVATLLGLVAFLSFLFAFEAADNIPLFTIGKVTTELLIEHHIFQYIEKLVWFSIFVSSLWLPNAIGRRIVPPQNG